MFQRIPIVAPIALLVLQHTAYVLLVRYTLKDGKNTYIQSSVVVATEVTKVVVSLVCLYREKLSFRAWLHCIKYEVFNVYHLLEMSGLSLLFTVQNNLTYFAVENLEAGVFLVNILCFVRTA